MLFTEQMDRQVRSLFQKRREAFPGVSFPGEEDLQDLDGDIKTALFFLYAHMPLSDVVNYPLGVFLDFAVQGVRLRREEERVRTLPPSIFGEYILFHRINTEEIRPCRTFFRERIGERLVGKSESAALLEMNLWCAENGTYHAADERTISALAFYERGYGRCGEESVFCVNALRSMGIPARQVYVPFWSHTDDNHAWVEAMVEGVWHFFGACEPRPVLNQGWFNRAASRAMLVHSRSFTGGEADFGEEEVIGRTDIATELNQLSRYTRTRLLHVEVLDREGKPVPHLPVELLLLNEAAFRPIARPVTDGEGKFIFRTGFGSLRLRPGREDYGVVDLPATEEEESHILLRPIETAETELGRNHENRGENQDKGVKEETWRFLDYTANGANGGAVSSPMSLLSEPERAKHEERVREAERLRKERTKDFQPEELRSFLAGKENREWRMALVDTLTDKDRTDCPFGVLEDHLAHSLPWAEVYEREVFVRGILSPRIAHEVLTPFREVFFRQFSEEEREVFRRNPALLWKRIKERVRSYPLEEREGVLTTPPAAWQSGIGSSLSIRVLFVAIARTCGLPSYLRKEDREIMVWEGESFHCLTSRMEKRASLCLRRKPGEDMPYLRTWTLSRKQEGEGTYEVLDLTEDWRGEEITLSLPAGSYVLTTANRLPKGNIYGAEYDFVLKEGEEREVDLVLREISPQDMLFSVSLPPFTLSLGKSSDLTRGEKGLFLWLEPGEEPTEHILNELLEAGEDFLPYQNRIYLILDREDQTGDPLLQRLCRALPGVQIAYAVGKEDREALSRAMYLDPGQLPLVFVSRGENQGIFGSAGYQVGSGSLLLRILREF